MVWKILLLSVWYLLFGETVCIYFLVIRMYQEWTKDPAILKVRKDIKVWDKVYLWWEKRPYKVMWRTKNFVIIQKPFNLQRTYLYSIINISEGRMWPDNLLFWLNEYNKTSSVKKALVDLEKGDLEVSERRDAVLVMPDKKIKSAF